MLLMTYTSSACVLSFLETKNRQVALPVLM